jgi:hypothetical protein
MAEQYICEFCSVVYKNEVNFKLHLIRSKKCLKKRGLSLESKHKCNECGKPFVALANLTIHQESCEKYKVSLIRKEYEKEMEQYKKENEKLNETIFELKRHHSTVTNELHEKYKKEFSDINQNYDKDVKFLIDRFSNEKILLEKQIERIQTSYENIVKEAINRPSFLDYSNKKIDNKSDIIETTNVIKEYKFGATDFIVPIRSDGMINATALCKAGGKRLDHYKENLQTKDFLDELCSVSGISSTNLFQCNIDGHTGTWVHHKVGYHLAQWISPKFAEQISLILDKLFIKDKVELKTPDEIDNEYKRQITALKTKLDTNTDQYQKLLIKHNSSLKTHRYIKFKRTDPCFYIIDSGIDCDCLRYKFGITGLDQGNNIDDRLRCHRTLWPQLKVRYLLFVKDVEMIEKSFKMMFEKEINPNGHEIIEGVTFDEMIKRIEKLFDILSIKEYHITPEEKLKEYNDYVDTTVK